MRPLYIRMKLMCKPDIETAEAPRPDTRPAEPGALGK